MIGCKDNIIVLKSDLLRRVDLGLKLSRVEEKTGKEKTQCDSKG